MQSLAATTQDKQGGYTAYLDLRKYPILPVLYAGAFGAVARRNGRMLAAFTTDPIVSANGKTCALPVFITPWNPFANSDSAASLLAHVGLKGGTIEEHAQAFQQGKGPRYYTPLSEYLFARLRDLAKPYVLDDAEYEQLFHRTETLIALAELDWMANNSDAVNTVALDRIG